MTRFIAELRDRRGQASAAAMLACCITVLAIVYGLHARFTPAPMLSGGTWDVIGGIDLFIPDDFCGRPWEDVFNDSEAGFLIGDPPVAPTKGGRNYNDDEVLTLYGHWQGECGPGIPVTPFPPDVLPDLEPGASPPPRFGLPSPTDFPWGFEPSPQPAPDSHPIPPDLLPGEDPGAEPAPPPFDNPFPPDFLPGQEPGTEPEPKPFVNPFPPHFPPGEGPPTKGSCPPLMVSDNPFGFFADEPNPPNGLVDPPPPLPTFTNPYKRAPDFPGIQGMATGSPVSLEHGHKLESATDILVRLPGRAFRFTRTYSSKKLNTGSSLIGVAWHSDVFWHIAEEPNGSQPRLKLASPLVGILEFNYDATWDAWVFPVPSTLYIVQDGDYWRLVEPGLYEIDFYREGSGVHQALHGHIAALRDPYGNNWAFDYDTTMARLTRVRLRDAADTEVARVEFSWIDAPYAPNFGRLRKIEVKRWDGPSEVLTQQVEYKYKATNDGLPGALGTVADLIQVTRRVLVDAAPAGVDPWSTHVTQYRYHGGTANETATTDADGDGLIEWGATHQLKAVILPEQVEYAVQSTCSGLCDVASAAETTLLDKTDEHVVFGTVRVIDLAAKVISQYGDTPSTGVRSVRTQFLQTSCGCSGANGRGVRLQYSYKDHDGEYVGRTTYVEESKWNGSDYDRVRELFYDLRAYIVQSYEFQRLENVATRADGGHMWVAHLDWGVDGAVIRKIATPAAMQSYIPWPDGEQPDYTAHDHIGLVYRLDYHSQFAGAERLHRVKVSQGAIGIPITLTAVEFGDNAPIPEHLPVRFERYAAAGDIETIEYDYGFHTSGGHDIAWIEAKSEAELPAENGPTQTHFYSHVFFNDKGQLFWARAADDSLTRALFDPATGEPTLVEANAAPDATLPDTTGLNGNFAGRSGDGSLTTLFAYDLLGTLRSVEAPGKTKTRFVRELRTIEDRPGVAYMAIVSLPHTDAGQFDGPATVDWYSAGRRPLGTSTHSLSSQAPSTYLGVFGAEYDYGLDVELSRSRVQHAYTGVVESTTVWHQLPSESDVAKYFYDAQGRLAYSLSPTGTIARYTYDNMNRVVQAEVGLAEAGTDDPDEATMLPVAEYVYGGPDENGQIVQIDRYASASDIRTTRLEYDWRGRLIYVEAPEPPHAFAVHDDLNRVVKGALYGTPITDPQNFTLADVDGDRTVYVEIEYGQRGLPYRQSVAIDATDLTVGMLESNTWYDEVGRPVAARGPGSPTIKTTYDGLGRVKSSYVTDGRGSSSLYDATYAEVYDLQGHFAVVSDDVVFEQTEYGYILEEQYNGDYTGLIELITSKTRSHDSDVSSASTDLGPLDDNFSGKFISTYSTAHYDFADRVIRSVDYGTNKNGFVEMTSPQDVPTIDRNPANLPNPNPGVNTLLVSAFAYETDTGRLSLMTDPSNLVTKVIYDQVDRVVAVIENYVDGDVQWSQGQWVVSGQDWTEPDVDRITRTEYNGMGAVVLEAAHMPISATENEVQVTQYEYAARTADGSEVNSNELPTRIIYPDGEASVLDHSMDMRYNRLGEIIGTRDQNGTEHAFKLDGMGRLILDSITASPNEDVDETVKSIAYHFLPSGVVDFVTSFNVAQPDVGYDGNPPTFITTEVVNQVQATYDSLWQFDEIRQPASGLATGSSPKVRYEYQVLPATSRNFSRLTGIVYPDGNTFSYAYGDADSSDDLVSRLTKLGPGLEVAYEHFGLNTAAIVDYVTPDVQLDRFVGPDGRRVPGTYHGYDRFGRVVQHMWVDGDFDDDQFSTFPTIPPIVQQLHAYDNLSNPLEALDGRPGADQGIRDRVFSYDKLSRLVESKRGVKIDPQFFNHGGDSRLWDLDMLGNWQSVWTDFDGSGTYDADESDDRVHNEANELEGRVLEYQAGLSLSLQHDKNGNLRTSEIPNGLGSSTLVTYTHDAWDRLVRVQYGSGTRAEFVYNGMGHCVIRRVDTDANGALDQDRLRYYSAAWQLLEEEIDDDLDATIDRTVQYLWGKRYLDDLVLRRENSNPGEDSDYVDAGDGVWYHLTDVQFSTVAVIDSAAKLLERVEYDAYGKPLHHWRSDIDGDRDVDAQDSLLINTVAAGNPKIGDNDYNVDADLNRDGRVNSRDVTMFNGDGTLFALPEGELSGFGSIIGFSGYVYNAKVAMYSVRMRNFDVSLGRWIERDPAAYVDGMNLYEYVSGTPLGALDPFGLCGAEVVGPGGGGGGLEQSPVGPSDPDPAGGEGDPDGGAGGGGGSPAGGFGGRAGRRPPKPPRPAPGLGLNGFVAVYPGDPRWEWARQMVDYWASIITPIERIDHWKEAWKAFAQTFVKEVWEEIKKPETLLDIALTLVPGGAILKVVRLAGRGRCFFWFVCFTAGTQVLTEDGPRSIEAIEPSECVWSYDTGSEEWQLAEVSATYATDYEGDIVRLTVECEGGRREEIEATGSHPFWVVAGDDLSERGGLDELPPYERAMTSSGRWTEARWLRLGDHFLTRTGKSATVVGLVIRLERSTVYNLYVRGLGSYAVGTDGLLVHNACVPGAVGKSGVYVWRSLRTGERYVGQSRNIGKRLAYWSREARKNNDMIIVEHIIEVVGNKRWREAFEQAIINSYGGVRQLRNIRDPFRGW